MSQEQYNNEGRTFIEDYLKAWDEEDEGYEGPTEGPREELLPPYDIIFWMVCQISQGDSRFLSSRLDERYSPLKLALYAVDNIAEKVVGANAEEEFFRCAKEAILRFCKAERV